MNELYMSSYFDINSKNDTYAPYIVDKVVANKEPYTDADPVRKVKEGYTAADFATLVSSMSNNKLYDMSSNLVYNPSDPEYIPTLREAAIEDKNQLIVQQNTMIALGAMSAASIAIVLYMIGTRS